MNEAKTKSYKKPIIIFASILFVILILIVLMMNSVSSNCSNYATNYNIEPDSDLIPENCKVELSK